MYIGLDYGTRKIGVAVGQLLTCSASAQPQIANRGLQINWPAFDRLYQKWRPQGWVVGIPLQLDGSLSTVTTLARQFAQQLQQHFVAVPVYTTDEQLTTQEAKRLIYRQFGGRGFNHHSVDSMAAKLILEAWLQQRQRQLAVLSANT